MTFSFLVNFRTGSKSPKLYLTDTALQLFMLNMDYDRRLKNFCLVGSVIENFVVLEVFKQISWSSKSIQLFHYRDYGNVEVDLILEGPGGDIVALEIKSSESVSVDDFKGLKKIQAALGSKFIRGVVLYMLDRCTCRLALAYRQCLSVHCGSIKKCSYYLDGLTGCLPRS